MPARRRAKDRSTSTPLTAAEFESLDGIGPVLAGRMVAYRELHGAYRSVDDLTAVSGIGPKRLAAIRARCYVDSL